MPLLIQKITGVILDNLQDDIKNIGIVTGSFGHGDWILIGNIEVFLQNFTKVIKLETLITSNLFGLIVNGNINYGLNKNKPTTLSLSKEDSISLNVNNPTPTANNNTSSYFIEFDISY